MKVYNSLLNKQLLLLSAMLVIFLGIITIWSSRASFDKNQRDRLGKIDSYANKPLKILNRTRLFTVVNARVHDNWIELDLKNNYDKPITSFQVSIGDITTQVELMANEEAEIIPPGGISNTQYPTQDELDTHGIKILAVLFDDQTGDGDPKVLYNLLQYREGMRTQRKYNMKLLEDVLHTTNISLSIELQRIAPSISPFSDDKMRKLPMNVRLGMQDEQQRLIQRIRNLLHNDHLQVQGLQTDKGDKGKNDYRRELTNIVESYRHSIRKL